jgi:hypothetical protein
MTAEQFRDAALAQLRAEFPGQTFNPVPDDSAFIVAGDFRLNLSNARKRYELSPKTDHALREIMKEYQVFWRPNGIAGRFPRSYEEARHRLLPQFMPPAIASDETQVRMTFAGNVVLGIVVDDDRSYAFLTCKTLKGWGQTEEVAFADAINNLDTRRNGLQFRQFQQIGATFFVVGANDGFAAARIAVPNFRTAVSGKLGYPFCFGIPNRDFLISWTGRSGSKVVQFARERLRQGFQEQPYPISPSVFQVGADGKITELKEVPDVAKPNASRATNEQEDH